MYFLLHVEVNHGFSRLFVTDTGTTIALDYRSRGPVSWFLGITSQFCKVLKVHVRFLSSHRLEDAQARNHKLVHSLKMKEEKITTLEER